MSNRIRPYVLACFAVLVLVGSCAAALETSAATITVTTTSDLQPGINVTGCSLREAVNAINNGSNGAGCNNSSNQRYGNNDVILFARSVGTVTLRYPASANGNVALYILRPVTIRGNGPLATAIIHERIDERGPLTLIQNSSELRLYRLRLSDAQTALINNPDAVAFLWSVHVTGHTWRAVVNYGRMTMLSVTVRNNVGGGGILNGNVIAAEGIVSFETLENFLLCVASGYSPGQCGHADQQDIPVPPDDTITFPAQQAPAQLTILRSAILNNRADECAGILNGNWGTFGGLMQPLFVAGSLTIRTSRISGNSSNDNGGGICNKSAAFISHSEISRNTATRGGGVAAFTDTTPGQGAAAAPRPSTTIVTSTISSNLAFAAGGGIYVGQGGGEMNLSYCTVAFNRANGTGPNDAGGIAARTAPTTVLFGFSALTNNTSGATGAAVQDCGFVALQGAFNFWPVADTGPCSLTGAGNVQTGNARLGTLAENGSPRRSHLPAANSALVDVIPANDQTICNGTDQRLQTRPREGNNAQPNGCDIGAVERP